MDASVALTLRRDAAKAILERCTQLLATDPAVCPIPLQQLVHFHRRCDGTSCTDPTGGPIYGYMYVCLTCDLDFCSRCWRTHPDMSHDITIKRQVHPDDAATSSSLWAVEAITNHKDTAAGREYLVSWEGFNEHGRAWQPTYSSKATLNNDEVVEK